MGKRGYVMENMYNLNIERSVLSAILFEPKELDDMIGEVVPLDFYLPFHQYIFEEMVYLNERELPIDEEFLRQGLHDRGKFDEVAMIDILSSNPITLLHPYIAELKEKASKRAVVTLATEMKKLTIEDNVSGQEVAAKVEIALKSISGATARIEPLKISDIKTEPVEIVCKDFLPLIKGAYNVIAGSGGVGKSTIALRLAMHYLRANPLKKAFLVMGEDDSIEIMERLTRIGEGFLHLFGDELQGVINRMLFITTDNSVSMRFLSMQNGAAELDNTLIKWLDSYIKKNDIGFVVLDPLKKFHSVNENSNSEMDLLVRDVFLGVASKRNVVMLILHHMAKSQEAKGARGAATITDTARIAYKVTKHYMKNKDTGEVVEDMSKDGVVKISTIKDNKNIFQKFGYKNTDVGDIELYKNDNHSGDFDVSHEDGCKVITYKS